MKAARGGSFRAAPMSAEMVQLRTEERLFVTATSLMSVRGAWVIGGSLGAAIFTVAALVAPNYALYAIAAAIIVTLSIAPGRGLYILFTFLFFVPVTIDVGLPIDPLTAVLAPLALISSIGWTRRLIETKPQRGRGTQAFWMIFVLIGVASVVNWPGIGTFLVVVRPFFTFALVAGYLVGEARSPSNSFLKALRFVMWVSVPVALLAVYQRITGTWPILDEFAIKSYRSFEGQNRSAGVMGHPIIYGTVCMMVIVLAIALRPKRWQLFVIANIGGLILTGSRSAWLATAVALLVWFFATRRKITGRVLAVFYGVAAAATVTALLLPSVVVDLTGDAVARLTGDSATASASARVTRIDVAWRLISDSSRSFFFGHGPGSGSRYFANYGIGDGLAAVFDNSYLSLWHDYGLITVLALATALVLGLVRGNPPGRLLLLAICIQIYFFDFAGWPAAWGVLLVSMALIVASDRSDADAVTVGPTPAMTTSSA